MLIWAVGFVVASSGTPAPPLLSQAGAWNRIVVGTGAPIRSTLAQVQDLREIEVPGTGRVLTWSEKLKGQTRPFYAISLDGATFPRVTETTYDVELKEFQFDPLRAVPPVEPGLWAHPDNDVFIIQFQTQVIEPFREGLADLGVELYGTFTQHSILARINPADVAAVRELPYVRWVGAYEPAYRMEAPLRQRMLSGNLPTQAYNIEVYRRGLDQQNELALFIELIGGSVDFTVPEGYMMVATLTPFQLQQVLRQNQVQSVCEYSELSPDMDNIKVIGGANYVADPTRGLFRGKGVRGEVFDTGFRVSHLAFNPLAPIQHNAVTTQSHGTSTLGICFGDGDGNILGQGLMPQGQAIIGVSSSYLNTGVANRYAWTSALLGAPYYCVFQTNSTGSNWVTTYTSISSTLDDILYLNDIVILQSQSNQGTTNSRPEAWAKNMVSIGAAYHFNNTNKADDRWNGGASIGPAADGRVKPDLYNAYDAILCTTSTNDTAYTTSFGGTSGATPITAGHFGLFFQMWAAGIFGNSALAPATPVERFVFDNRPKAATTRAIMINTASQSALPLAGGSDISRSVQGWGMADLTNLYNYRRKMLVINETDVLTNLQTKTTKLWVPAGEPALKVTMVYLDPKGTVGAANARINDLSLRVTAPNGTQYWGNNAMSNANWTSAGGAEDTKNVVENVYLQSPVSGVWTVEVIGSDINTDARVETPGVIDADYALVATGVVPAIAPSAMDLSPGSPRNVVSALELSDNTKVTVTSDVRPSSASNAGWMEIEGTSPLASLASLQLRVESSAASTATGRVKIEFWDYVAGGYEMVADNLALGTSDAAVLGSSNSTPSRFVQGGSRAVKARITWYDSVSGNPPFNTNVDQVRWLFAPQ
ncbi:MAG: hypothetical protein K1X67_03950 [Fimbriimonadaceae bacterium]|nr:hypothetical protein [Fimbriimonadaceae bacterium]